MGKETYSSGSKVPTQALRGCVDEEVQEEEEEEEEAEEPCGESQDSPPPVPSESVVVCEGERRVMV
jgi:hypothetical protein